MVRLLFLITVPQGIRCCCQQDVLHVLWASLLLSRPQLGTDTWLNRCDSFVVKFGVVSADLSGLNPFKRSILEDLAFLWHHIHGVRVKQCRSPALHWIT